MTTLPVAERGLYRPLPTLREKPAGVLQHRGAGSDLVEAEAAGLHPRQGEPLVHVGA